MSETNRLPQKPSSQFFDKYLFKYKGDRRKKAYKDLEKQYHELVRIEKEEELRE